MIFSSQLNGEHDAVGIVKQHNPKWLYPNLYRDEMRLEVEVEELLIRLGARPFEFDREAAKIRRIASQINKHRLVVVPAELSSLWPQSLPSDLSRIGWQIGEVQILNRNEVGNGNWFELHVSRGRSCLLLYSFKWDQERDLVGIAQKHKSKWLHPRLFRDEMRLALELEELLVGLGGQLDPGHGKDIPTGGE